MVSQQQGAPHNRHALAVWVALLLAMTPVLAAAQTPMLEAVSRALEFRLSIADIAALVELEQEQTLSTELLYLLSGTIVEPVVLDPNPETFYAESELVTGRWSADRRRIETARVLLVFDGPQFDQRFQTNAPSDDNPAGSGAIVDNARYVVFAEFAGVVELGPQYVAVFVVHYAVPSAQ